MNRWQEVSKADPRAVALADRHYSRRSPGARQFLPPGKTFVLIVPPERALFAWYQSSQGWPTWRRDLTESSPWVCLYFRNEARRLLASDLILEAEAALAAEREPSPDGLLTYVDERKVRSTNPGYCFLRAGWRRAGRSTPGHGRGRGLLIFRKP